VQRILNFHSRYSFLTEEVHFSNQVRAVLEVSQSVGALEKVQHDTRSKKRKLANLLKDKEVSLKHKTHLNQYGWKKSGKGDAIVMAQFNRN